MYEYNCNIVKVVDGDTVDVDIDLGFGIWLRNERVRLYGIDTPECRTRDPEEKHNLISYKSREVVSALREFRKAIDKMPKKDGQPRYEKLSGSYYDVDPEVLEKQIRNNKKKGNHSPSPKLNKKN